MNYYERHLGDYAKDTGELTMLEHGAYTILLDYYYSKEHGIPADKAYRVTRAATKEERAAVDLVLTEYFTLRDGMWVKDRCEEDIERALVKITAAQENGRKGGRPKKPTGLLENKNSGNPKEPTGFPLGSLGETQTKALQTPDTSLQAPEEEALLTRETKSRGEIKPEGEMAIALRDLGVSVTSMDQTLAGWIRDGITVQQAVDAVGLARIRKPYPERIPANYLDPILRQPQRPPVPRQQPKGAWQRMMEANGGE